MNISFCNLPNITKGEYDDFKTRFGNHVSVLSKID